MTGSDLARLPGINIVVRPPENLSITGAYVSDLLSDVMANAAAGDVLVTIQAHRNTVAVAALSGIAAIVICNGRQITDEMREAAENEKIGIFSTDEDQFNVSRRIAFMLEALRR